MLSSYSLSGIRNRTAPHELRGELWPVVRTEMLGWTVPNEEIRQNLEYVMRSSPPSYLDRQTLPRVLVEHCEQLQGSPVLSPGAHEVIRPDMVLAQRPKPDTGAVVQPQPTPLGLAFGHFQALSPPDPLHPLVVHRPTLDAQQVRHLPVSVATETARQPHHVSHERHLVGTHLPDPALRRPWLAQHPARAPLAHPEPLTYMHHTPPSALGAQKFPLAASSRINLSTVRFATARFRCVFSRSSSLSLRA